MQFLKIFRDAADAVLHTATHSKRIRGVTDKLDLQFKKYKSRVTGLDEFTDKPDLPGGSGGAGTRRPGFNADGSVNPDDFRTPRDGAYYWSGMWPRKGDEVAGEIASRNNATTLEMLIESRGIEMPEWDADNPAAVDTWTQVSEAYASGASGTVRAVLGDSIRPDAVWWSELERLKANPNITQIIEIHPDTLVEKVIWPK